MEALFVSRGAESIEHRLEIADGAHRQFVAHAKQDRRRRRHGIIVADKPDSRQHGGDRIGGTAHDDEANQGIAEAGNHPGQRERKQDKRDDIDETEPSGQQCQRGKTKRSRHGHDKQDGKSRPPGKQDLSGGVSFVHFCSRCGWRDRLRLLIQHRLVQITV